MLTMQLLLLRDRLDRHRVVAVSARWDHPVLPVPLVEMVDPVPLEDPVILVLPEETVPFCRVLLLNHPARSVLPALPDPMDPLDPRDCPDPKEILESPERTVFLAFPDRPVLLDLRVHPEISERRERLESPERSSMELLLVPLAHPDSPDPRDLPALLERTDNQARPVLPVPPETQERREPMDCPDPMDLLDLVGPLVSSDY